MLFDDWFVRVEQNTFWSISKVILEWESSAYDFPSNGLFYYVKLISYRMASLISVQSLLLKEL